MKLAPNGHQGAPCRGSGQHGGGRWWQAWGFEEVATSPWAMAVLWVGAVARPGRSVKRPCPQGDPEGAPSVALSPGLPRFPSLLVFLSLGHCPQPAAGPRPCPQSAQLGSHHICPHTVHRCMHTHPYTWRWSPPRLSEGPWPTRPACPGPGGRGGCRPCRGSVLVWWLLNSWLI